MKRFFYWVPLLGLATASFAADTVNIAPMDFSQARDLAHDRADMLKIERAETARRESEAQSARSLHGPKLTLDAKQVWGRKTIDYGSVTLGQFMPGAAGQLGGMASNPQTKPLAEMLGPIFTTPVDLKFTDNLDGPRATVNLEMPIYMGGAINAKVRASDEAVFESRAQTQAQRDQIDTELAQKYFAVQLARSVVALHQERVDQQEDELRKARRFEATGMISKLERMTVEVNRDAAKRDLLAAQTDCRVAEAELAGILREETVGELSDHIFVLTGNIGTLSEWQQKALRASPVLQSVQAKTRQADQGVIAAKAAWHPQVYAFGQANLIKHYLAITEPDWIAGIGVKFTLWDNKDRNAEIAAARSVVTKAQAAHSEATNRINTAVETAYLRSSQARDQYRLTASTLELAQENLRLREKAFGEGLSTADEVNDARNKLLGAEVARRLAAYRFVAAWAALNGIAGTMNEFVESITRNDNIIEK